MIATREVLERLVDGRSFSREPHHPSGLPDAIRISPPASVADGYEDVFLSSSEFLITSKHIEARRTFADDEPGLGRLVFVFHLRGKRTVELAGSSPHELTGPMLAVYYQAAGIPKRSIWAEGDCETSVVIGFWPDEPPSILRRVLGCSPHWRSIFAIDGGLTAWAQRPLSIEMERTAREVAAPNVHPALLPEYLVIKANELLCLGCSAFLSPRTANMPMLAVREAQQIIDRSLQNVPTLTQLATTVRLPPTLLATEFRKVYGVGISEYIHEERMLAAGRLLRSTSLPLKQIAYELGYNHTSNFCLAFKRRFGVTASQVRRDASLGSRFTFTREYQNIPATQLRDRRH
jgi:AraC-like DNA-binding protein